MNAVAASFLIIAIGAGGMAFVKLAFNGVAHLSQLSDYVASCIPRRGGTSTQEPPTPSPTPTPSPSPRAGSR